MRLCALNLGMNFNLFGPFDLFLFYPNFLIWLIWNNTTKIDSFLSKKVEIATFVVSKNQVYISNDFRSNNFMCSWYTQIVDQYKQILIF